MTKTEKVLQEDKYHKTVQYQIKDEYSIVTSTIDYSKVYYLDNKTNEINFYLLAR